jgi:hypothetical protein
MGYCPGVHRQQHRLQRTTERCQPIFDTRRDLSEIAALDQTIRLKLPQLLGKRPMVIADRSRWSWLKRRSPLISQ